MPLPPPHLHANSLDARVSRHVSPPPGVWVLACRRGPPPPGGSPVGVSPESAPGPACAQRMLNVGPPSATTEPAWVAEADRPHRDDSRLQEQSRRLFRLPPPTPAPQPSVPPARKGAPRLALLGRGFVVLIPGPTASLAFPPRRRLRAATGPPPPFRRRPPKEQRPCQRRASTFLRHSHRLELANAPSSPGIATSPASQRRTRAALLFPHRPAPTPHASPFIPRPRQSPCPRPCRARRPPCSHPSSSRWRLFSARRGDRLVLASPVRTGAPAKSAHRFPSRPNADRSRDQARERAAKPTFRACAFVQARSSWRLPWPLPSAGAESMRRFASSSWETNSTPEVAASPVGPFPFPVPNASSARRTAAASTSAV